MKHDDLSALWYAIYMRKGEIDPTAPRAKTSVKDFTARMDALVQAELLIFYGGMYYVTEAGKIAVAEKRGPPRPLGDPHPADKRKFLRYGITWRRWIVKGAKVMADKKQRALIVPAGPVFHLKFDGEWVRYPAAHMDHMRRTFGTQDRAMLIGAALLHGKPQVRTERNRQ